MRPDGQNANTYEDSEIDNYLENELYNSLSSTMKAAIQPTNIKQVSYLNDSPDAKQETGYLYQVYNTISRHAFLPSVSEIGNVVDLKNPDKVKAFLNGDYNGWLIWTRDSRHSHPRDAETLYGNYGGLYGFSVDDTYRVRPAFVIDLSGVKYTIAGHVDYK